MQTPLIKNTPAIKFPTITITNQHSNKETTPITINHITLIKAVANEPTHNQ